ncbi:hypothetical protein [uncultured Jatrophihabitans sp.]|uniref:hypothetical protein n=1 Tax=uncultured Jatrophihabitans sp. TaxID=1610747 RepID=UPI0035CCA454
MGRDEELPSVDFVVGEPFDGATGERFGGRTGDPGSGPSGPNAGGPSGPTASGPSGARVADPNAPELPERPDRVDGASPSGPRWGRRLLAAGALVAAVVVAAVHGRGQHAPTGAPTNGPTSSPASSAPATTPVLVIPVRPEVTASLGPSGTDRNIGVSLLPVLPSMPPCPSAGDAESACNTLHAVPAAFTAAVHAAFPRARQRSALSVQVRDAPPMSLPGVWSRSYVARANGVTVEVTVLALHLDNGIAGVLDDGAHTRVFSEQSSGGKLVFVQAIGASGHAPSLRRVEALARDPRLLSV